MTAVLIDTNVGVVARVFNFAPVTQFSFPQLLIRGMPRDVA